MGRRGGKNGGRGRRGGARGGWRSEGRRADYTEIEKRNHAFETYYNRLGIVDESEREDFWAALRRELPNSFRFTGSKGHALAVQQRLIDYYIPEITAVQYDGQFVEPPKPVEWFPERLAWSMTTPKQVVRRFPPFASFQKFLVSETSVGNISRQEIVSMIPPLLLDVKPGMTVLDLCAAPGSKSAQLIEMVHGGEEARVRRMVRRLAEERGRELSPDGIEIALEQSQADCEDDWSDDGRSTGLLIANDVDYRRAQMLVHQMKRLNSPNLIVTNHDATMFPSIKVPSASAQPTKYLKFDRILADVPCSGDGTLRKNPAIWKDWTSGNGLGLHLIQVRILVRALQMLKVGGRVVYSTCSMNPVENEAVVASAIDRCGGTEKVRLVDCGDALPGLQTKLGLSQWQVMDKSNRMWNSWKEVIAAKESNVGDGSGFGKLMEGMFAPSDSSDESGIPLERCLRIYPHMQDTGAFFITVLEKLSEIKARPEEAAKDGQVDVVASAPTDAPFSETIAVEEGTPAIARQDQNSPTPASPFGKRAHEDEPDSSPPSKRVKLPGAEEMAPPENSTASPLPETSSNLAAAVAHPSRKSNQPHEEPFKYLDADHEELLRVYEFFDISSRFPRDRFMVRNALGQPAKAIYYTSELARQILTLNEGRGMKFVHCGVKMFMKQDAQGQDICRWRIQSEGLPIVEPWVGEKRIVRLYKRDTLQKLLKEMFPRIANGGWMDLGEIGESVRDIGMGCCVLRVETGNEEDGFKQRLVLPLWRSLSSLNLMLPKEERKAMLLRLYNDDSPLVDSSKDRDTHQGGNLDNAALEREKRDAAAGATDGVEQNGTDVGCDLKAPPLPDATDDGGLDRCAATGEVEEMAVKQGDAKDEAKVEVALLTDI